MQRDWDTIRDILIALEERTDTSPQITTKTFEQKRAASVSYNVQILQEAGLIEASVSAQMGMGIKHVTARRMTWQGHELLDAIRNDSVWEKTKKTFIEKSVGMTFDLVKSVAAAIVKDALL